MSATFYRKTLGVGPYETVDDYFADVNPDGSFMAFVQNQKDNGLILELEMKLAKAKNAVYSKTQVPNEDSWHVMRHNAWAAYGEFNFKMMLNALVITEDEFNEGA